VDDHAAPREERVPVAVHQHALHDRLGQVAGPGAGAAHPPRGDAPGGLLRGRAAAAGGQARPYARTQGKDAPAPLLTPYSCYSSKSLVFPLLAASPLNGLLAPQMKANKILAGIAQILLCAKIIA
uniref:Uncharacterized protein n=1 Tax=Canis lupus dingo TaxID=286419 RepID=A0A8C0KB24_CANLU